MVDLLILLAGLVLFAFIVGRFCMGAFRKTADIIYKMTTRKKIHVLVFCIGLALLSTQSAEAVPLLLIPALIGGVALLLPESVQGAIGEIFQGAFNAIMKAFADLICLLLETFGPEILAAIDAIPTGLVEAADDAADMLAIANSWAPIVEGSAMFVGYLGFLAIQLPIKLLVKLFIPTVG